LTIEEFENLQNDRADTESISELLEQESRRYNRRFDEEDRIKV
jgi:hypothetical protein